MSWSDRRTVLLGALALAGCGFRPVYGPGGSAEALYGTVAMAPPADADGFALGRRLRMRLGDGAAARYRLDPGITVTEVALGITPGQVTTRFQFTGAVDFRLVDLSTGATATAGRVASFSSYSATGTVLAIRVARRDARDRLMATLADQLVARLLATAADWR